MIVGVIENHLRIRNFISFFVFVPAFAECLSISSSGKFDELHRIPDSCSCACDQVQDSLLEALVLEMVIEVLDGRRQLRCLLPENQIFQQFGEIRLLPCDSKRLDVSLFVVLGVSFVICYDYLVLNSKINIPDSMKIAVLVEFDDVLKNGLGFPRGDEIIPE